MNALGLSDSIYILGWYELVATICKLRGLPCRYRHGDRSGGQMVEQRTNIFVGACVYEKASNFPTANITISVLLIRRWFADSPL